MDFMEQPLNPSIQHPEMRLNVRGAVDALADPEYQERVWIRHILPSPSYEDSLDMNIHILMDDTEVGLDPQSQVGFVLFPNEVQPMRALGLPLQAAIDALGDADDLTYIRSAYWPDVVRGALPLAKIMAQNDADSEFRPDLDRFRD